jgi:two-component system cell cycle sensor histidine kinase/response regulator CckA
MVGSDDPNALHVTAPTSASTETILVVDDDATVRTVVCRGLRAQGYTVLEAWNGEDALTVAEAFGGPIDVVVTDIVMPQMDGRALFGHFRMLYPASRYLFMSGYAKGPMTLDDFQGARTRYIAKPFGIDRLCTEVRSLLDLPALEPKEK